MLKLVAAFVIAGSSLPVWAQMVCLGFHPEANLECEDGGETYKVHAFEDVRCGAGRDGVLNDSVPIQDVDGPTWTDSNELAQVTFKLNGETVTLDRCAEVY